MLESVQRRATKYILNDYTSDYRSRLIKLDLLPLMYYLELNDVMFCVQSLKSPSVHFNILDYVSFSSQATRSGTHCRMTHLRSFTHMSRHYFFNRIARLWNSIPLLDLTCSTATIKSRLLSFFKAQFMVSFDPSNTCTLHFLCPCSRCSHFPSVTNFNLP